MLKCWDVSQGLVSSGSDDLQRSPKVMACRQWVSVRTLSPLTVCTCEGVECEKEIDDCALVTCHNGGRCLAKQPGHTTCLCLSGFTGIWILFDHHQHHHHRRRRRRSRHRTAPVSVRQKSSYTLAAMQLRNRPMNTIYSDKQTMDGTQMSQWNKIVYIKHYSNKTNKYENRNEHRLW